jgi:acid phosphatase type 7
MQTLFTKWRTVTVIKIKHDRQATPVNRNTLVIVIFASVILAAIAVLEGGRAIDASAASTSAVLVGAGDISSCSNDNDAKTAELLGGIPGTVFTVGDNVYSSGTNDQYKNCYQPTWGRYKDRTKPVPGNHDYATSGAAGYYRYFRAPKYYAYDRGAWRIYALNSEIDTSADSAQAKWLKKDLASHPRQCVMAYWHRALWSSGWEHGVDFKTQPLWDALYDAGAEVIVTGHDHDYERFAPVNKEGLFDYARGLREFVVGTGGKELYPFGAILGASEARNNATYGVLKLTLHPGSYDWEFIPISGQSYTDSGSTNCH